jgi:hypothetical protein
MSTDRELLELAAKAAGMNDWKFTGTGMAKMLDPNRPETTGSIGRDWNPLTDDGDALRLAVALHIGHDYFVDIARDEHCCAWINHRSVRGLVRVYEPYGADPCAATRRAIVQVAALIGVQT